MCARELAWRGRVCEQISVFQMAYQNKVIFLELARVPDVFPSASAATHSCGGPHPGVIYLLFL